MPRESNLCSTEDQDKCIESHLEQKLKNSTFCQPHWMPLDLPYCNNRDAFDLADNIIKTELQKIDKICQKPCHFLNIRTGKVQDLNSRGRSLFHFM